MNSSKVNFKQSLGDPLQLRNSLQHPNGSWVPQLLGLPKFAPIVRSKGVLMPEFTTGLALLDGC